MNIREHVQQDKKKILEDIGIFLIIIICIAHIILSKKIGDLDEIWNYNFANCIAKGMVPYKDFNIVITPLLAIIESIFLRINNQLLTIRILSVLLNSSIVFLIYKTLEKLKINRGASIIATAIISYIIKDYFCIDYNWFVLFLSLIIINIEFNKFKSNNVKNIIIGILAGMCVCTKQTTGALICFAIIVYRIIIAIKTKQKNEIKKIIFTIIGMAIPTVMLLIYLVANGAINGFIDYCILGIKTFNNKISYVNLIKSNLISIKILAIIVPISMILLLIHSIIKKDKKTLFINFIGIANFIVTFPISDNIHFLIGSIITIIGIMHLLNLYTKDVLKNKKIKIFLKFFCEYLSIAILILATIWGIYKNYQYIKKEKNYSTLKHFENIDISKSLEKTIQNVENYIKSSDKKVYIIDSDAALYNIPIDIYNKDFDMFNKGNLGGKGEEGQIEKIQNMSNVQILIRKDGLKRNWQTPETVRKYIQENLEKQGSIENFDIYYKE